MHIADCHQIDRTEANFVYGDYKLVVELIEDSHWFWRAYHDAHGTTSSYTVLCNPKTWKQAAKDQPHLGQWTDGHTIPARVADAAKRHR